MLVSQKGEALAQWHANCRGESVCGPINRAPGGFRAVERRPIWIVRRRPRQASLLRGRYPEGIPLLVSAFPEASIRESRTATTPRWPSSKRRRRKARASEGTATPRHLQRWLNTDCPQIAEELRPMLAALAEPVLIVDATGVGLAAA
jgi:hypothetical protein